MSDNLRMGGRADNLGLSKPAPLPIVRRSRIVPTRLLLVAVFILSSASILAEDWLQWRGPANDGRSPATKLPASWKADSANVTKVDMPGPGASTPCIVGDRMVMTAQVKADVVLFCISRDGKPLWQRMLGRGEDKYRGDEGNLASASCSSDGKLTFAFSGTGMLGAYAIEDGKPAWEIDCKQVYGAFKIQFGGHWTPVLHKGILYVTLMHRERQTIFAFDAATGKELWKAERKSDGKGESPDVYCSPFLWQKGDKALLIVHGNDYCTAHDLKDGSEVWRVSELNPKANYNRAWRAVSSPLVTPDLIVIPSCKQHPTVAVKPEGLRGNIPASGEAWRFPKTPDVPSPLLVDDVVYLMGAGGQLNALDAATGKLLYEESLTNERHRSNPMFADGKLYLLGREGTCPVLKAGRTFEELAKNKLPDTFTASPVAVDGKLYLRGWKHLWIVSGN